MSTPDPLHEARTVVADLRQNLDKTSLIALKQALATLEDLLGQPTASAPPAPAAPPSAPPSEEAEHLRQEIEALKDQSASFTSLMVHEIRKPMTSIRGYADMLAKPGMMGTLNDMQQQFADTIRSNIIKMEGLVSDVSDMNKLNASRHKLDIKMTTFGQILTQVQKNTDAMNAEFGHALVWDVPASLPILNVDSPQLIKVIGKLLNNSIQYTPKTGTITLKAEAIDGGKLRVSVTDTGIGMSEAIIARLGEPFFRGDHELVTSQKGYGLGIPVAMGFLKLMGTTLEYTSEPNKGSTFSFVLTGME